MTDDRFIEQAAALRDFFASVDAGDLRVASAELARLFGGAQGCGTDWTEVEYDFNRLFVGPAAIPAPPYASAYQDEPLLMGAPAMEAREAYRRFGLAVPDQGSTPDDHLAFELDAAAAAAGMEGDSSGLLGWLVGEHMPGWVPRFVSAVRSQTGVSAPVLAAVEALSAWLDDARSRVEKQTATKE